MMDKLSFELNKETEKTRKEDIIIGIKMLHDLKLSYDDVLDKVLQYFGKDIPKDEIKKLVKENYQVKVCNDMMDKFSYEMNKITEQVYKQAKKRI